MRPMNMAGYEFTLPDDWSHIERRSVDDGEFVRAVIAQDLTFSALVVPRGGAATVDGYFKTAIERYADGAFRGFDVEWIGIRFRGWHITHSSELSAHPAAFANFYGTVNAGDAVCWAWLSTGEPPADPDLIEYLGLVMIGGAIARRSPNA